MNPSANASRPPLPESFERARELFLGGLDQLAQGQLEQAEQAFVDSLALLPGRVSTLINLAAVRVRLGRANEALDAADQVLAQERKNADAWFQRAEALAQLSRLDEALEGFRHAADYNRSAAMPWYRHGQVLQDLQRDDEALGSYDKAVAADPSFAPAWTNKGNILRERSLLDEAAQAFREAIARGGADPLNTYYLASVSDEVQQGAGTAPGQYVEGLFDSYAESFERHVLGVLGYRAHEVLADEILKIAPGRWFHSVLDLGCGTGLCGGLLKTNSERITGVDLSSQMLAQAQATGVYAQLVRQDVAGFLQATDSRYDLVLAADVFIYVGDLAAVFAGVQRAMAPDGLFAFSLELLPAASGDGNEGYALQSSLRFAHTEGYARRLAATHGLEVIKILRAPLRQDQRKQIEGLFVFLQGKAAA